MKTVPTNGSGFSNIIIVVEIVKNGGLILIYNQDLEKKQLMQVGKYYRRKSDHNDCIHSFHNQSI